GIVYDNQLIGSISLLNPDDDLLEAEAGYCLAKNYWGMGITAEALSAILDYAFMEIGFKRIHAKHDVNNPNSGKVMKKCGLKYIETANKPLALKPDEMKMCDCYEILNMNHA
ncbi:MAG TPA: GNAT family N-acetyltransferase, partial [Firmicutes bacterium]|nr:GNAT family N-acetyltransferase [Bacillota bacterium]